MAPFTLTPAHADVVLRLANSPDEKDYSTRKALDLDADPGDGLLRQMARLGLVESTKLGSRATGWRLTAAGRASLDAAREVVAEHHAARRAAWDAEHRVYGQARAADAPPLTPRQQAAWVAGYAQAQLAALKLPADAPPEVAERYPELLVRALRRLAPHRPEGF